MSKPFVGVYTRGLTNVLPRSAQADLGRKFGPDGRQLLIDYLDAVYFRWFRRGRCKLAATQLLTPDALMPLGDYGSGGA